MFYAGRVLQHVNGVDYGGGVKLLFSAATQYARDNAPLALAASREFFRSATEGLPAYMAEEYASRPLSLSDMKEPVVQLLGKLSGPRNNTFSATAESNEYAEANGDCALLNHPQGAHGRWLVAIEQGQARLTP